MRSYLAMMMLRAGSRLVRSQRCGGVEMLRKIAEYAKKDILDRAVEKSAALIFL